jgi:hypothetical protein
MIMSYNGFEFSGMAGSHVRCNETFVGFTRSEKHPPKLLADAAVARYAPRPSASTPLPLRGGVERNAIVNPARWPSTVRQSDSS